MLNPFPELLYPFFAPTLLRVGLAVALMVAAYMQWKRQDEIVQLSLPVIGRNSWWVWVSMFVYVLVAVSLLFGYYTQVAAMLAALLSLKQVFWANRFPLLFPLGRAAGMLMLLISVSLIFSGAGALAKDLPL
jgi:uncharacterized membrane protein YphA (DoxX/SURF4 family)